MRLLREIHLSAPVCAWLAAQGYTVYAEVPWRHYRTVDLVGKKGEDYLAVELKTSLSWAVIHQAYGLQMATPLVYVGVGTRPLARGIEACRARGIGVLSIQGDVVTVLLEPRDTGQVWSEAWRGFPNISRMSPGGQAGRPTLKGEGPAQDVSRRVAAYRKLHPAADWRELYAKVQNHYANAKSMRYSLTGRGLA